MNRRHQMATAAPEVMTISLRVWPSPILFPLRARFPASTHQTPGETVRCDDAYFSAFSGSEARPLQPARKGPGFALPLIVQTDGEIPGRRANICETLSRGREQEGKSEKVSAAIPHRH